MVPPQPGEAEMVSSQPGEMEMVSSQPGEAETELPEAFRRGNVAESVNYRLSGRFLLKKQWKAIGKASSIDPSILQSHVHTFMDPSPQSHMKFMSKITEVT